MCLVIRILIFSFINYVHGKTPNVLLIVIDDLKPALGCYGDINAFTPNINAIARKSFIFDNAYAQVLSYFSYLK